MDDINGLLFCSLSMLFLIAQYSSVETEQISIVMGKNFVISFQEDASRDVFNPLREKLKLNASKIRQNRCRLFILLPDRHDR
jgi:magnesium transporter